jgi:hypothetical protein
MAAGNLDAKGLRDVVFGGLITEDVLRGVYDLSPVDRVMIDAIGSDPIKNVVGSWVEDTLRASSKDNAVVDGSAKTANASSNGVRLQNYSQISEETVAVSVSAQEADTIDFADELAGQVEKSTKQVWKDTEAAVCSLNGSVEDDGAAVAGKTAGLEAWLEAPNTNRGATGLDGGFGGTTAGIVDPATPGTARAMSEAGIKDILQAIYDAGGDPTMAIMRPAVKRLMSEYFVNVAATGKIVPMRAEQGQSPDGQVAKANVEVWQTDFGMVELHMNRSMVDTATDASTLLIIDPEYLRMGYLYNLRGTPQGVNGLSNEVQIHHQYLLKVLNRKTHGAYADIDHTTAMVA